MNIGISKEITLASIMIDDHEYQAPMPLVRALESLKNDLAAEQKKHEQTKAEIQNLRKDDFDKYAKRIIYNLSQGNMPVKSQSLAINGADSYRNKFKKDDCCLAHDIYDFTETDSNGNPIYSFSDEVYQRITEALKGNRLDINNKVYSKFKK